MEDSLITQTRTVRASTICCIVELPLKFFEQNLAIPCSAVTFDNSMSANIGMGFRSIITHPDSHIRVERANRCGPSGLQRIPDNRCDIIIDASIDGHQSHPQSPRTTAGQGREARTDGPVRASSKSRNNDATAARQMLS
jgi:hypothetical protein